MTTKAFGRFSARLSLFKRAVTRKLTPLLLAAAGLLLLSGCIQWFRGTGPVLHRPLPCDLSPVLTLQFPERIETLAGVPRTKTLSQGGTNKLGGRLPDDIKERFCFNRGATEYTFTVFYSDAAALKEYRRDRDRHVYREVTENGLTGRVHYTEEPRADGEGGSGPMGNYYSRADFLLRNLYVRVDTSAHSDEGEKPRNDKLSNAVLGLADMLRRYVVEAGN